MSANTSITEGGKGYSFGPVKCLMVEGDNGEFYPWYPEADRALDSLSVDKNGIYRASDRGVYGWNYVSVNVAQSDRVTGKDPETGEEKTVTVDPQTGELVETVVPGEIRVTTLPTKTVYSMGETIAYSGIVVHAYSSTGQDMGAVPFNELVFPVTTAQGGGEWTDGHGLNAMMVYCTPHYGYDWRGNEYTVYVGQVLGTDNQGNPASYGSGNNEPSTRLITRYNGYNFGLLITGPGTTNLYSNRPQQPGDLSHGWVLVGGTSAQLNTERFSNADWAENLTNVPVSTKDPTTIGPSDLHATQSLPVQWQNPDSGAILETSFNITITGGT